MKPTKNRVYCKDSCRQKMLFETEKKANTFIKFNSEEIESESGYSPNRSYYCISCNGWHVTSKKEPINIKSRTEIVLELYKEEKEKRALESARIAEHLESIEKQIEVLEASKESGSSNNGIEILNRAFEELEIAKGFVGSKKRKKNAEDKLNILRKIY